MNNSVKLSEIIDIKSRFGRSVNLERDFYADVSLNGYVLTTTALSSLERLIAGLENNTATRAWTLTGAFGSGKSTFALFAAKIFNHEKTPDFKQAERIVKSRNAELWTTTFEDSIAPKFLPILVSGSREPLAKAILRGVKSALKIITIIKTEKLFAAVETLERLSDVTGEQILRLFDEISNAVNSVSKQAIGLMVVIDELGKLLEYAAINPHQSDIFVLQQLAEATRRKNEKPFFLMTILHQAFERYAERLGKREREEWAKIQGRFEDLPFQEPNEQVLHILESVFAQDKDSAHYKTLHDYGIKLARQAFDLKLCGLLEHREAVSLLRNCLPLHPTVALALGGIFRRFGQNERSLFAFLTSGEPFGLTNFLKTAVWTNDAKPLLRLDRVYDYLISAMGSQLYASADGRKWSEVEAAIKRIPAASNLEIRVLKVIGLLYLLGETGNLKNSPEILHFALADETNGVAEIDSALESLQKKSIVTFRRFNDTYIIWEGSDINLDDRFREAERHVDQSIGLAENLTEYFRPRPVVAKRHSYRTGTLRYVNVAYTDAKDLEQIIAADKTKTADASVIFALATNIQELNRLLESLAENKIKTGAETIVAVPKNLSNLRESVRRTVCWHWVGANTPELENDRAAGNELKARLAHAEQMIFQRIEDWLRSASSENCEWFWRGKKQNFTSPRQLQAFLSDVFDEIFPNTPILKNELINRQSLSGAATTARKALFEAMLTNSNRENLGIEQFPPQLSMYFSLLQETTIHRVENGKLEFYPPNENADAGIRAVWQAIENFLDETESGRKTCAELFECVIAPPFGLKAGIIPILLVAVLLYYDAEVALYERGNFLPKLTLPIFERLCRAPEAFSLQLCRIAGMRVQVLDKMAKVLLPTLNRDKKIDVLTFIRPFSRFAHELNDYTQNTTRLSKSALAVRRALFSAREPDKLLFKSLPEACGMKEFTATEENEKAVEKFSKRLHENLSELRHAYPELLNELEAMLSNAFSLPETGGRDEIAKRARNAAEFAASAKIKSFILRVSDDGSDRQAWLESIAALFASKPPYSWKDEDLAKFEIGLAETARQFINLETLVFERRRQISNGAGDDVKLMRLSLTLMKADEHERVLTIHPQDEEKIKIASEEILKAFEKSKVNGNLNLRLAILADLSLKLLEASEKA